MLPHALFLLGIEDRPFRQLWQDEALLLVLSKCNIVSDEKALVDMPVRREGGLMELRKEMAAIIPAEWDAKDAKTSIHGSGSEGDAPSSSIIHVRSVVDRFLLPAGSDVEMAELTDFVPSDRLAAPVLPHITHARARRWINAIHDLWPSLCLAPSRSRVPGADPRCGAPECKVQGCELAGGRGLPVTCRLREMRAVASY